MTTCFFGGQAPLARFDKQTHAIFEKLTVQQLGYMWRETEVDISRDQRDFRALLPQEQHIFTANLKRQILLDTEQGRCPSIALLPIVSLPEVENWIQTWTFFETIHSRSYTHIIRNVYTDPSEVFDGIMDIKEIVQCKDSISRYYDELIVLNHRPTYMYAHKTALWKYLMSVNVLEGVRFYASFACSWAFAEQKASMEGNAKIIKLICRDENLHLAAVQHMMKVMVKEDPDFARIAEETKAECAQIFEDAVEEERTWAKYLFQYGSMIGLNEDMLIQFVEQRAGKLMKVAGLPTKYKAGTDPLPWTQKWISGSDVQVAPQETELTSYTSGALKQDVDKNTFAGFSL